MSFYNENLYNYFFGVDFDGKVNEDHNKSHIQNMSKYNLNEADLEIILAKSLAHMNRCNYCLEDVLNRIKREIIKKSATTSAEIITECEIDAILIGSPTFNNFFRCRRLGGVVYEIRIGYRLIRRINYNSPFTVKSSPTLK